jgi:hypothetical protein
MKQWHPLFVQLLRPLVERYYDVQTTVPVGDAPREADLVLLRRTAAGPPPFRGLWKHLTTWNILEFKGPTVSPRARDLDLLVELGLGIDRRLNAERVRQRHRPLAEEQVSFWYLARRLGDRFLRAARRRLGRVEDQGGGVWRGVVVRRPVVLVSSKDLPVDADSVPLHLLSREPSETGVAVARLVVEQPVLWETYNQWLLALQPEAWREVEAMARATRREFTIDIRPVIEAVGVKQAVEAMGLKRVVDEVGLKRVVDEVGLKRVVDEVGLKRVLEEVGYKRVLTEMGVDDILSHLTPAQRAELKRKLR